MLVTTNVPGPESTHYDFENHPMRGTCARNSCHLLIVVLSVFAAFRLDRIAVGGEPSARKTENVILVTYDGLRWQEVFGGCDDRLLNKENGGVRDVPVLTTRFWRDSAESRREALLPFFWKTIARQGQVFGSPEHNCPARVTNGRNFSYPGYNEILTGFGDERIDSNAKRNNHNVTVLEWLHTRPAFAGKVAVFCSWDVFPYIINAERSGIPVNAGWEPFRFGPDPSRLDTLNDLVRDTAPVWDGVRDDALTFYGTLEYIRAKHPRVVYMSFDATDDWAHEGRYDRVLDAVHRTDSYIEKLWTALEAMPEYAGKTALVLTTDHGRGDNRVEWKNHGKDTAGSDQMWIALLGPDIPSIGIRKDVAVTQSQVAATVAALLGEDYAAAEPRAAPKLPWAARE